jgi:hypothetical protein
MDCKYYRECPNSECCNVITYTTKRAKYSADIKKSLCKYCSKKNITNPFYNLDDNTIKKIRQSHSDWYEKTYGEINNKIINLLLNTKLTYNEICLELNIKKGKITYLIKKLNIKRPKVKTEKQIQASKNNMKKMINSGLKSNIGVTTIEHYKKIFKSRYGYEYDIFIERQSEYKKYYKLVRNLTNKNLKKYSYLFSDLDKLGRCGVDGAYQVDHIFSIKEGFIRDLPPSLISNPSNLNVIRWEDNLSKSDKSYFSLDELIINANNFLTKYNKLLINIV